MYKATKPGAAPLRVEQRHEESITYTIDCTDLLQPGEIIFGLPKFSDSSYLSFTEVRTHSGKFIKFKVEYAGQPITTPYLDILVTFKVSTSFNSTKAIPVSIRIYK